MDILEQFKHAESFELMSMGDKLIATGYAILLGMFVTFTALILIMYLTKLMSFVLGKLESGKKEPAPVVVKPEPVQTVVEEADDDEELIAVITAAVAASMNTSMHNIVVTNITRVQDTTPVWGKSGRNEVMGSRL
ncbi:OadG family protein [Fusibacter sp. JL298sf-3]